MVTQGQVESLLIAELKHRLANSFQLLQAVIHIRLRSAADPDSRRHLSWLLDVVTAFSLLQQRVGVSGPTEFGAYLTEAASYWRRICEGRSVAIELDVEAVHVSETEASTLALIAHELISNALEHAFPDGRAGVIRIRFREDDTGARHLVVTDDGCGLPIGWDGGGRQGVELVRGLASHLGGRVELQELGGVTVRVSVPRTSAPQMH